MGHHACPRQHALVAEAQVPPCRSSHLLSLTKHSISMRCFVHYHMSMYQSATKHLQAIQAGALCNCPRQMQRQYSNQQQRMEQVGSRADLESHIRRKPRWPAVRKRQRCSKLSSCPTCPATVCYVQGTKPSSTACDCMCHEPRSG